MAIKKTELKTVPKSTPPVEQPKPSTAIVATSKINFEADEGAGFEHMTKESFAIPFLTVLQKGSPQVDEASGVALEGAKAGMLFESVTGRMFPGATGVQFVLCDQIRTFIRWAPRSQGGGFKGEIAPEVATGMRARGEAADDGPRLYVVGMDGKVNPQTCDRLTETYNHMILLLDPETGDPMRAMMSLSSTQIKKARTLATALENARFRRDDGSSYKPATFAHLIRLTTVPESNEHGNWFGVRMTLSGEPPSAEVYEEARAFYRQVHEGTIQKRYVDEEAATAD